MKLILWEDDFLEMPETPMPIEGWHGIVCSFESHTWALEIEEGCARIMCCDPCDIKLFNPAGPIPVCHCEWLPDDLGTPEPIPVKLTFINDSTSGGPWGPAEYSFYIEVRKGD